jgi:hypothetical protein
MITLDLHGVRYEEVPRICHAFINTNWGVELKIITGNSDEMKQVVVSILRQYSLDFHTDNSLYCGSIRIYAN